MEPPSVCHSRHASGTNLRRYFAAGLRSACLEVIQRDLDGAAFLFEAFLDQAHEVQIVDRFQHGFVTLGRHHVEGGLVVAEHGPPPARPIP